MMFMGTILMMLLTAMTATCIAASVINRFFDARSSKAVRTGRAALSLR